jgi:uncharacterized protein YndB with AHSA1/START domain
MPKPSFVGFQEKVVIPEGFEQLEIRETIPSDLEKDDLFTLLGTNSGLSQWFFEMKDLDLRPGGKVNFVGDAGESLQAVCTSVVFGKEISLIADIFGNFAAKVSKAGKGHEVELRFAILTDDVEGKRSRIEKSLEKLREIIS